MGFIKRLCTVKKKLQDYIKKTLGNLNRNVLFIPRSLQLIHYKVVLHASGAVIGVSLSKPHTNQ